MYFGNNVRRKNKFAVHMGAILEDQHKLMPLNASGSDFSTKSHRGPHRRTNQEIVDVLPIFLGGPVWR